MLFLNVAFWPMDFCGYAVGTAPTTSSSHFRARGEGFARRAALRRMSETAAHLVDHVIPQAPVRQWVLPEFVEIPAPSEEQVWEVLERIIKRVMKQLVRLGILVEDQGETYLADADDDSVEARTLRPLHRGSCVYRIAFGPRAGRRF